MLCRTSNREILDHPFGNSTKPVQIKYENEFKLLNKSNFVSYLQNNKNHYKTMHPRTRSYNA